MSDGFDAVIGPDGIYWADVLGLHDGNGQDVALMLVIFCILFCFLILSQLDAQWVLSSRQMEADCADLVMNALDSFARNSDILRLVLFVWGTLEFSSLTTAFFATLWDDYKLTDIDIESIQFYNKCYLDILGRAVVASSAIILTFAPLLQMSMMALIHDQFVKIATIAEISSSDSSFSVRSNEI